MMPVMTKSRRMVKNIAVKNFLLSFLRYSLGINTSLNCSKRKFFIILFPVILMFLFYKKCNKQNFNKNSEYTQNQQCILRSQRPVVIFGKIKVLNFLLNIKLLKQMHITAIFIYLSYRLHLI